MCFSQFKENFRVNSAFSTFSGNICTARVVGTIRGTILQIYERIRCKVGLTSNDYALQRRLLGCNGSTGSKDDENNWNFSVPDEREMKILPTVCVLYCNSELLTYVICEYRKQSLMVPFHTNFYFMIKKITSYSTRI